MEVPLRPGHGSSRSMSGPLGALTNLGQHAILRPPLVSNPSSQRASSRPQFASTADSHSSFQRTPLVSSASSQQSGLATPANLITYAFPDFRAVEYFVKDFDAASEFYLAEETQVSGLDIYLIEQWLTWRRVSTVICAFTGDTASKATVVKFTVAKQPLTNYPPRFQEYLSELARNHAKPKTIDEKHSSRRHSAQSSTLAFDDGISADPNSQASSRLNLPFYPREHTHHEVSFVTSVGSLAPELVLIPITLGDFRIIEPDVIINIDLKRLQCTGRSLDLTLSRITDSIEMKLRQTFRIQGRSVPVRFAACELVNLTQTCLFYFELLDPKYCDGFLCDKTLEAITQWWNLFGLPFLNARRQDKETILSPRTVAGILSMILSIRLRLQMVGGCDVSKDPLDFESFLLSVGQFQKQYHLEKRRKLDLETVEKLFDVTNALLKPEKRAHRRAILRSPAAVDESSTRDQYATSSPMVKKKHKHYTLEFRKLKSAVKSTVQDKMIGGDDALGTKGDGSVLFHPRMTKIADSANPLDVETLDLDYLVKNFLIGPRLVRLFYGVSGSTPGVLSIAGKSEHTPFATGRRSRQNRAGFANGESETPPQYRFISLKQQIIESASSSSGQEPDASRYSRGLNKMKMGLHRRADRSSLSSGPLRQKGGSGLSNANSETGRNGEERVLDDASGTNPDGLRNKVAIKGRQQDGMKHRVKPLEQFQQILNRRNSFPFDTNHDLNLNILDASYRENRSSDIHASRPLLHERSNSDSALDAYFASRVRTDEDCTMATVSDAFFKVVKLLERYDQAMESNTNEDTGFSEARRACLRFNSDVIRLNNAYHQMDDGKARIFNGESTKGLEHSFSDMKGMIDRLVYESRIVDTQIKEVEESYRLMDLKLREQCESKVKRLVGDVASLYKFYKVFPDVRERENILRELGAKSRPVQPVLKPAQIGNWLLIMLYEVCQKVLRFFNIDSTKFNTERIQQSWGRVDPGGQIMHRANSIVGRRAYLEGCDDGSDSEAADPQQQHVLEKCAEEANARAGAHLEPKNENSSSNPGST